MNQLFPVTTPEAVGIDSTWLSNFLTRLENEQLPLHSAIIMRHGKVCLETYYKPYSRDTLHRMFSITKSFVSLAVGLLEDEGKLSLEDKIIDYFPEKLPTQGAHPYLAMLTIKDMLAMTTCHDKTTYKLNLNEDWVGSFFTVPPTHVPGTNFSYDTSSTHTLGALVEKLTGMELLDYLRDKFLNEIGFSQEAYVLKDPFAVSMGGSGMCAKPYDLLRVMSLIANKGVYNGRQLLPKSYIERATKMQSDPYGKQGTLEEMQGYGYQFWLTRHNGFVMFGMGGQLALYVPQKDIIMITTADAQGRQGGVQLIYEAFWNEIYNKISSEALPDNKEALTALNQQCEDKQLMVLSGNTSSAITDYIKDRTFIFEKNPCGIKNIKINIDTASQCGCLLYENASGNHKLAFGLGHNEFQQFPDYNLKCAASACFHTENTLLIKIQIIDSAIGNLYFSLNFKGPYVTVMFRKIEESLFNEYQGVFSGISKAD